jgi:hypothetical protein
MTMRSSPFVLSLGLAALGCATPQGTAAPKPLLIANIGAPSDVTVSRPPAKRIVVEVEPIAEEIRRDPARMAEVRVWMERQIALKLRTVPEGQYERQVRPQLRRELERVGLSEVEVDAILGGVDYHRSL